MNTVRHGAAHVAVIVKCPGSYGRPDVGVDAESLANAYADICFGASMGASDAARDAEQRVHAGQCTR